MFREPVLAEHDNRAARRNPVREGNSERDRRGPAQGSRATGKPVAVCKPVVVCNPVVGSPVVDRPVVDMPVGGNRAPGKPILGNPGNPGNREAARSPGGAAVVVDHGSHTVEHRGISQRAVMFAGLGVPPWSSA
jgi:hypothetical protein